MRTLLLASVLLQGCYSSVGLEPYLSTFDGLSVLGFCNTQGENEVSIVLLTQDNPAGTLLTPETPMKDGSLLGKLLRVTNFQFSEMEYAPNTPFNLKPIDSLSQERPNPSFYSNLEVTPKNLHLVVDVDPAKAGSFIKEFAEKVKTDYTLVLHYAGAQVLEEDVEEWVDFALVDRRDFPPNLVFEDLAVLLTDRDDFHFKSPNPVIVLHVPPSRNRGKGLWSSACASGGDYIYIKDYQSLSGFLSTLFSRLEGVWRLLVESNLPQTSGVYLIEGQLEVIIGGRSITFQLEESDIRDTRGWIVH